ncbi:Barstar (barnase inhibitor) [Chitinophaga lutea]|uniref:Barstar (Barnase inhibitor) n=1 Tax=Chitinophaga lutea TaxID=2488634 RepID=A0A3N4PX90_9BACT|nr:barstar family protein [Chitinophaga lutea]RPE13433.1 Barstar (barnase inhibitor) [Chitinophaga lutea]
MNKRIITLDGNNFSDLAGFYDEVENVLTKDLTWTTGRNFNAFNDLLRGGFGVHEPGEQIMLVWKNSAKSKADLNIPCDGTTVYHVLTDFIKAHWFIEFAER